MKYRKLDSAGDYTFGQNAQGFLTDANAVAQAIRTNLLLLQGEWWEDTAKGVPLFQNIISQSGIPDNLKSVDLLVQNTIISTKGVSSVQNFASTYVNRTYTISCTANTIYGTVNVQVPLEVTF